MKRENKRHASGRARTAERSSRTEQLAVLILAVLALLGFMLI